MRHKILMVILPFATLMACRSPRYMYSPAAANVPLLKQKGDSKLAVNYSTSSSGFLFSNHSDLADKARGIDVQSAYAITNKYALLASFYSRFEQNGGSVKANGNYTDNAIVKYRRNFFEAGVGYFAPVGNRNAQFQFFVGGGKGLFKFTDKGENSNQLSYQNFHQAYVTKLFFQPAFLFQDKLVAASFSSRITFLKFSNVKTDYTIQQQEYYHLDNLNRKHLVLWEPAFINNFGFKRIPNLRFEWQLGFSFMVSNNWVDIRNTDFSLGLVTDLAKLLRK